MINAKKMTGEKIEFLTAWGIMLITDGRVIGTLLPHACKQITDKGCGVYEKRPFICKGFKGGGEVMMWRPVCHWYEPIPEDERAKMLKSWAPAPTRTIGKA